MADEIDFDEMERYEAELRDEIGALTEQNKLLENELVAVSAERDKYREIALCVAPLTIGDLRNARNRMGITNAMRSSLEELIALKFRRGET